MKLVLSLIALLALPVSAQVSPPLTSVPGSPPTSIQHSVTLAWDRNAPEEQVAGYRIYWGTSTGTHNNKVEVGDVSQARLLLPARADYYFVATAYNDQGESLPSDELFVAASKIDGPPSKPATPTVKVVLQSSVDMKTWKQVASYSFPETEVADRKFYRGSLSIE